jgi:putative acetyltransferase
MRDLLIRRESIESRAALELIAELNAELSHRYPEEGANHFRLDVADVQPGRGAFLIARVDQQPVACGAVRRIDEQTGEMKRMYVLPKYRRAGVGGAMVVRLEEAARGLGVGRLVLETGVRQPDAIALYKRHGFTEVPLFGEYVNSPLSVCMAKELNIGKRAANLP